jgi:hypothetical protein
VGPGGGLAPTAVVLVCGHGRAAFLTEPMGPALVFPRTELLLKPHLISQHTLASDSAAASFNVRARCMFVINNASRPPKQVSRNQQPPQRTILRAQSSAHNLPRPLHSQLPSRQPSSIINIGCLAGTRHAPGGADRPPEQATPCRPRLRAAFHEPVFYTAQCSLCHSIARAERSRTTRFLEAF